MFETTRALAACVKRKKGLGKMYDDRFWNLVDKKDDDQCWNWIGAMCNGYGKLKRNGTQLLAHRVSWTAHFGMIPKGLFVCHHCDNRACVNPNHLFVGTHADNMRDAAKKGRLPGCSDESRLKQMCQNNTTLIKQDVLMIKEMFANGIKQREIAVEFGITRRSVSKIVTGVRLSRL